MEYLYRRKKNGRYERVRPFTGFPADGVWLVQTQPGTHRETHIMRVGDLPDPMPLAALMRHSNAAMRAIARVRAADSWSPAEMWWATAKEIAKAIAQEMEDDND